MNIYEQIGRLVEQGRRAVLVTVAETYSGSPGKEGFKLLLTPDGTVTGTVGGGAVEHQAIEEAKKLLKLRKNRILPITLKDEGMECGGKMTLFFEYIEGKRNFILFGGGHIGRALKPVLESAGFRVTVFDSRPETEDYFKKGKDSIGNTEGGVIIGDYNRLSTINDEIEMADFCFIATHGHDYDFTVLSQLLNLKKVFKYIGMIGSKTKAAVLFKKLEKKGHSIPDYLYSPAGIKIGGDTAGEIAISIAAEVVAIANGMDTIHMRINPGLRADDNNVQRFV
ncbi:MAG: hypothetical protein GXP33_09130 [Spirochaetes bacterium]|nr:hypothetical protein [Spirochaetota bacterium]